MFNLLFFFVTGTQCLMLQRCPLQFGPCSCREPEQRQVLKDGGGWSEGEGAGHLSKSRTVTQRLAAVAQTPGLCSTVTPTSPRPPPPLSLPDTGDHLSPGIRAMPAEVFPAGTSSDISKQEVGWRRPIMLMHPDDGV